MNYAWCRPKPIPLFLQALHLSRSFPDSIVKSDHKDLVWSGILAPRPNSLRYLAELKYSLSMRPTVRILQPNLSELSGGLKVPHLFSQTDQTLCLHYHEVFKAHMKVSDTIVPWAVMWAEYFEWWLATGEWFGDEIDHSPGLNW